jgi:hypothetical protein
MLSTASSIVLRCLVYIYTRSLARSHHPTPPPQESPPSTFHLALDPITRPPNKGARRLQSIHALETAPFTPD